MKNKAYEMSTEEAMSKWETSPSGLSIEEAKLRLERDGKNEITAAKKVPAWLRFVKQLKHIMMIVLFIAMILKMVSAITKEYDAYQSWLGAGLIGFIIFLNAGIGFIQESKAEKSVEALKKATKPFARVVRNGEVISIKTEELVVGDIVLLEAGDIVPADIRLIETASLMIEEAALTGESVPVEKGTDAIKGDGLALGDMRNIAFTSGIVTYGRARGVVVATAMETQLGVIAHHLTQEKTPLTPFTVSLNKTMRIITAVSGVIAAGLFLRFSLTPGYSIIDSLLITIAIGVAAIPEALPICVSITMSLGVQRMSKRKAIVKNLTAVETLGNTQIICSDKTGTITLNKMTVSAVYPKANMTDEHKMRLMHAMVLCNDTNVKYDEEGTLETLGDPTEAAMIVYANKFGFKKPELEGAHKRVTELPFDSARKMMSTVNETSDGPVMYTKGAFEIIKSRCTQILDNGKVRKITDADLKEMEEAASGFTKQALRVLGLAYKPAKGISKMAAEDENDLIFIGMTGLIDPPREEVTQAVATCKEAGIITIMITGDHKDTAFAIAKQVGIADSEDQVVTGKELEEMDEEQLKNVVMKFRVYARVNPEHKLRIVKSLRSLNKVVAMTGDGVNDAPSIKAADIGIGMGITGTEVTKGAADVILTDDNFATIVTAVEEGRRTYSNILKIVVYLISLSLAEIVLLSVIMGAMGIPLFTPLLILWINVATDTLPAIALGSLRAEDDIMKKKPNESGKSLFRGVNGVTMLVHAIFTMAIVFAVFFIAYYALDVEAIVASTMSYVVLGTVETVHPYNLIHIRKSVVHSKPFHSRALNLAVIGTILLVVGSIVLPLGGFQAALGITQLTLTEWAIAVGGGVAIIPLIEVFKFFKRRYFRKLAVLENAEVTEEVPATAEQVSVEN